MTKKTDLNKKREKNLLKLHKKRRKEMSLALKIEVEANQRSKRVRKAKKNEIIV